MGTRRKMSSNSQVRQKPIPPPTTSRPVLASVNGKLAAPVAVKPVAPSVQTPSATNTTKPGMVSAPASALLKPLTGLSAEAVLLTPKSISQSGVGGISGDKSKPRC